MEPVDLRIGNKVNLYGQIATVQANDFCENTQGIAIDSGKPIPLTKEWLLKYGFVTDEITYWLPEYKTVQLGHFGNSTSGAFIPIYKGGLQEQLCDPLDYVHELQNFYHSLKVVIEYKQLTQES